MPFDLATAKPVRKFDLATAKPVEPKAPAVSAADRVEALGTGGNQGIASLAGLPMDTAMNVVDLATAGLGMGASLFNGGKVPDAFGLTKRGEIAGTGEWIANKMDKNRVTNTQNPRPDDKASRYLHTAGAALPSVATMRPTTIGQGLRATAATELPAMASQATAEKLPDNNEAQILAGLATQAAMGKPMPSRPPARRELNPIKLDTLKRGQAEGLVVPISTTNPTVGNRLLESWGGKTGTRQDASIKNAAIFDRLAKRSIEMGGEENLTPERLKAIRADAGLAYDAVKKTGTVVADDAYRSALADIAKKGDKVAKTFKTLAKKEVSELADDLNKPEFDAETAIDATAVLRERAKEFYKKGESEVGKAYKTASNELENLVERNLEAQNNPDAKTLLTNFRAARKLIAKTHTVEDALNEGSGSVEAHKFGRALDRGAPLEGDQKLIGKFAKAFPKASMPDNDSGSVRNTDVIVGGMTAGLSGSAAPLLYPFTRMAARDFMLSPTGQKLAIPKQQRSNYVTLPTEQEQVALALLSQLQSRAAR